MGRFVTLTLFAAVALGAAATAAAHCQIPCGIFDDELRVQLIEEHITTVEKSIKQVVELGEQDSPDYNQLVRWVDNKEHHAQEIQDIVTAYFMAQRIKTPAARDGAAWQEYQTKLSLLHQIQVAAMKAKQTTDLKWIEELRSLVKAFRTAYFGEDGGHTH
jgi:nickel superoxide dismutase